MAANFNFTVTTEDLAIKFSCANHKKRIDAMVRNLQITGGVNEYKKMCRFSSLDNSVRFSFDGEEVEGNNINHEAVFFENTDYPLIVRGRGGRSCSALSCISPTTSAAIPTRKTPSKAMMVNCSAH